MSKQIRGKEQKRQRNRSRHIGKQTKERLVCEWNCIKIKSKPKLLSYAMYLFNGWHRCMNQNLIWSNSIVTLEIYFPTKKVVSRNGCCLCQKKILIERRNGDIFPMLKNKMFWWVFIFRLESFTSKINRIWLKCCRQFGFFVSFQFTIFCLFFFLC